MDFCNDTYVRASHSQTYIKSEGGLYADTASRILQHSSGNAGLECEATASRTEENEEIQSKETASTTQCRPTDPGSNDTRLSDRRRRRSRKFPWQNNPNFIRYEFQSERYCAYRKRQQQNGGSAVWPDDVEECFQYALRILPILGRRKDIRVDDDGGQGGRNELIQDYIKKWTGIKRTRKQVSSHLQVLKGYMFDNEAWLRLTTSGLKNDVAQPELKHEGLNPDFPNSPPYEAKSISKYASIGQSRSIALPPPMDILGSNVPCIHQVNFEICIKDCNGKKIHTYTNIQSDIGSSAQALEDISAWRTFYPDLASYYDKGQVDSEVILLDTNLNLTQEYPPPRSALEINPFIVVAGGRQYCNWQSSTYLYERGRFVSERRKIRFNDRRVLLEARPIGSTSHVRVTLNIQSKWWATNVFHEIVSQNYNQSARAHESGQHVQQAEEWGRRFLGDMSMMQEVYATPEASGSELRRIAVLLWRFRQTEKNEAATTTWRKLLVPNASLDIHSTDQSPLSLSIPLLSSMDPALHHTDGGPAAPVQIACSHQPSFFVDDAEGIISRQSVEEDSSFSTPTPDLRSLPSSTGTSFASFSEPPHPTQYVQRSSFQVQNPAHFIHSSEHQSEPLVYHTQDPAYHSQAIVDAASDVEYVSKGSPFPDSRHLGYQQHSQSDHTLYRQDDQFECPGSVHALSRHASALGYIDHSQSAHSDAPEVQDEISRNQFHESHSDHYIPAGSAAFAETAPNDFNGGHIHISFAEETQQQRLYDQNRLGPPGSVLSRYGSFNSSEYEDALDQVHQSDHHASQACSTDEFQRQESFILRESQHYEQAYSTESLLHDPIRNEVVLHHPQPQASLQHHIDSARWQTHTLWTQMHLQCQNDSGDYEEVDDTLKIETTQKRASEQIPEGERSDEGIEQEQGRILGEVSKRLEQELEKEMARDAEMEV